MKEKIEVSRHETERGEQRCGYNKKLTKKLVNLAFKCGKRAEMFDDRRRAFLKKKEHNGCKAIYYNQMIFIFKNNIGVTMYKAPKWFYSANKVTNKGTYIRNEHKYNKYNFEPRDCKNEEIEEDLCV